MSKRFWAASAAVVAFGVPAVAFAAAPPSGPGALPDFPADAEPGASYARLRTDGSSGPERAPGVWTLKRGHGPEAVWSYSEPGPGHPATSGPGYRWVRVLCEDGRTAFAPEAHAHRGPPSGTTGAGLEPPPPPFAAPPPPPHMAHPPAPPPPPPLMVEPEFADEPAPPFHAPPWAHGPSPGAEFPGPHMGPHFAGPPMPPPPPPVRPRWFGDRYLHWAGKAAPGW